MINLEQIKITRRDQQVEHLTVAAGDFDLLQIDHACPRQGGVN